MMRSRVLRFDFEKLNQCCQCQCQNRSELFPLRSQLLKKLIGITSCETSYNIRTVSSFSRTECSIENFGWTPAQNQKISFSYSGHLRLSRPDYHVADKFRENMAKLGTPCYPLPGFQLPNRHQRTFPFFEVQHRKFYSDSKEGDIKDIHSDVSDSNDTFSNGDTAIQNDPWVKSLLADLRRDFDEQEKSSKNPPLKDSVDLDSNKSDSFVDKDYEYDYQYAGDDNDIEEFGYFDEGDIMEDTRPHRNLPISLKRGVNGVFELDELLALLEHLGATNIVTVPIPPEARYCNDMVIVTAKSRRHLVALNDEMLWVHKRKKSKKDPTLHIEGKDKSEWCAMDIGNIVLHIFMTEEKRQYYDIESLWLLGPDKDPKCHEDQTEHGFALSAEELYWMEVEGVKQPAAVQDDKTGMERT